MSRPHGIIRITEPHITAEYESPALKKLYDISLQALHNSGRLFTPSKDGITSQLARLMTQHGIQNVQTRVHRVVYQAGTQLPENETAILTVCSNISGQAAINRISQNQRSALDG